MYNGEKGGDDMARDVQKALEWLEQALDEEELEEDCDENEEYEEEDEADQTEEYEEEAYEEAEDYEEDEYEVLYEEPPQREGVRHGGLKVLAMLLMTAIAVMLLVIAMKIKGMIP